MDNILELELVSKTFPKSNYTLDKVSFSIPYGAIMGFVGENGAGKTTTIGCILNTVAKTAELSSYSEKKCRTMIPIYEKKLALSMTEKISPDI